MKKFLILIIFLFVQCSIVSSIKQFPYSKIFIKYSKKYNIPLKILISIATVENSTYDTKARSHKDAFGLMQVRVIVVREYFRINKKMNMNINDKTIVSMLKIPELNIQLACWLLNYLYKKHKNWIVVISHYNTGEYAKKINFKYVNKVFCEAIQ